MRIAHSIAFAAALLTMAGSSHAVVFASGPVKKGASGTIQCQLLNVGPKPLTVNRARIRSGLGIVGIGEAGTTCVDAMVLNPGQSCKVVRSTACDLTTEHECHCVVRFKGAKKSMRAAIMLVDSSGDTTLALPLR